MFVGGTRLQRRAGSAAVILIAGALSSACVSSGREEAGRIADTGLAATSALSADLVGASARLARADALSAWERTWLLCQNPNPALCRPAGRAPIPSISGVTSSSRDTNPASSSASCAATS